LAFRRAASTRCARRIRIRGLDWPSPADGDAIVKNIINGQAGYGGTSFTASPITRIWIIADVAESDIGAIKIGTNARVAPRAYLSEPIEAR
jgi:Cu(I)/Ag(I) efflux system membrane fusion protein